MELTVMKMLMLTYISVVCITAKDSFSSQTSNLSQETCTLYANFRLHGLHRVMMLNLTRWTIKSFFQIRLEKDTKLNNKIYLLNNCVSCRRTQIKKIILIPYFFGKDARKLKLKLNKQGFHLIKLYL